MGKWLTLFRSVEADRELLHAVVDQVDIIVRHESGESGRISAQRSRSPTHANGDSQLHNVRLDTTLPR